LDLKSVLQTLDTGYVLNVTGVQTKYKSGILIVKYLWKGCGGDDIIR